MDILIMDYIHDGEETIGWVSQANSRGLENWKATYILSNESCILPSRTLAESWLRKLHQRYLDLEPFS